MVHHGHNRPLEDNLLGRADQIQAGLRRGVIPCCHLNTAGADGDLKDRASFALRRMGPKAAGPLRPAGHGMGFLDDWGIEHPVAEGHHSLKRWN